MKVQQDSEGVPRWLVVEAEDFMMQGDEVYVVRPATDLCNVEMLVR